jgi:hypothetical protein
MKQETHADKPVATAAGTAPLGPILEQLRILLPELRQRYGVDTLEVFGSRVRGEASPQSDLDLLVTFRQTPGLLRLIALENEISDRLGVRVDLVMRTALKPRLRERVLREAVAV